MATPALPPNAQLRWSTLQRLLDVVPADASLLEVGPGQGAMGVRLASRVGAYTGIELDATSAAVATARLAGVPGAQLLHGDVRTHASGPYDVVCAFEVLEHLEDDRRALADWTALLRPGGHLLLSVPMGAHRMGAWDEAVGHYRRYDRGQLADLLTGVGLTDLQLRAYGFPLGYALETARNLIARRRGAAGGHDAGYEERTAASGRQLQPPSAAGRLLQLLTGPFELLQLPFAGTSFGTGLVARATLPG